MCVAREGDRLLSTNGSYPLFSENSQGTHTFGSWSVQRSASACLFPRPLDQLLNLVSTKSLPTQLNHWPQPISSIYRIIYWHTPQYNYEHGLISIH